MAVTHDVTTKAHSANSVSASEGSFQWTHIGAASGIEGVLVFVWTNANSALITSVTYGALTMAAVSGGEAQAATAEPGRCSAFFLGRTAGVNLPQGTQTIVVTRTNSAVSMTAVSFTVTCTAGFTTAVHTAGINLITTVGTIAEVSVTDGSPGTNSLRFAGGHFGHQTPPTLGASSSNLTTTDPGATCFLTARETTAGQGSRPCGFDSGATSDDRGVVTLAIKEVAIVQSLAPSAKPLYGTRVIRRPKIGVN